VGRLREFDGERSGCAMQPVRVALTSVLLDDCQDIVPRSVPTGCSGIVGSDIASGSPGISQITVGDHEKYKSGGRGAPLQGCPFQAPRAWTANPPGASTYSGVPTQGAVSVACAMTRTISSLATVPRRSIKYGMLTVNQTAQFLLIQRFNCAHRGRYDEHIPQSLCVNQTPITQDARLLDESETV
jgi:hypothetical protein